MKQHFSHFFLITLLATAHGFCEGELDNRISELESDMTKIRAETALGDYGANQHQILRKSMAAVSLSPQIFFGGNSTKEERNTFSRIQFLFQ